MKHSFLLDENILYLAVRGINNRNQPDITCAELLHQIAKNCHHIKLDKELLERYFRDIQRLRREEVPAFQPVNFIIQFLKNSAKAKIDYAALPDLPQNITVPREDTYIVRAALLTNSLLVTADEELLESVNGQEALNISALNPIQALELAQDQ